MTTASGGTVFLLSVGGNHLRSYINICTFSFHLFQKPRPVKIGSGLNVRSPFQGENLWKPQNVEKGGTGEYTGHSSTGGWRLHPTGVGTAPGKKPPAPHRCGQHPLTQPVSEGRDIHGSLKFDQKQRHLTAREGSFSESSDRRCDGQRGT